MTRIDNLERCRTILESHNWNIEEAVQRFQFDQDDDLQTSPSNSDNINSDQSQLHSQPSSSAVVNTSIVQVWTSEFYKILQLFSLSFTHIYENFWGIFRYAWSLIRPDSRRCKPTFSFYLSVLLANHKILY